MESLNPYSTPHSVFSGDQPTGCYRHQREMLVYQGAVLPKICPMTGEPVEEESLRDQRSITWIPLWAYSAVVLAGLPVLLLIHLTRKRGIITFSLSKKGKRQLLKKKLGAAFLILLGLGLIITALVTNDPTLVIPGVTGIMFIILGAILIALARPLNVIGHSKGWFVVSGCSVRFLKALPPVPADGADEIGIPAKLLIRD